MLIRAICPAIAFTSLKSLTPSTCARGIATPTGSHILADRHHASIPHKLQRQQQQVRTMASTNHTTLSQECLQDLYDYWFEHSPRGRSTDADFEIPKTSMKRWYGGEEGVDAYCEEHFRGAVEAAIETPMQDLVGLGAEDTSGKQATGLVILLDQMPRNIYRGKDAKIAYEICDPKAQELAKIFTSEPYNFDSREICTSWWQQSFLYMPFMHAETPELHELYLRKVEEGLSSCTDEKEQKFMNMSKDFAMKHYDVIKRFGRYPSRNDAVGRQSTKEEEDFLKNGPGW